MPRRATRTGSSNNENVDKTDTDTEEFIPIFKQHRYVIDSTCAQISTIIERQMDDIRPAIEELKKLDKSTPHTCAIWKGFFVRELFNTYSGIERVIKEPETFDARDQEHWVLGVTTDTAVHTTYWIEMLCMSISKALTTKLDIHEVTTGHEPVTLPMLWKHIIEYNDFQLPDSFMYLFCELALIVGLFPGYTPNEQEQHFAKFSSLRSSNEYVDFVLTLHFSMNLYMTKFVNYVSSRLGRPYCQVIADHYLIWLKHKREGRDYVVPNCSMIEGRIRSKLTERRDIPRDQQQQTIEYVKRKAYHFNVLYFGSPSSDKDQLIAHVSNESAHNLKRKTETSHWKNKKKHKKNHKGKNPTKGSKLSIDGQISKLKGEIANHENGIKKHQAELSKLRKLESDQ